ncbi:MAG: hypothetical protein MH204_12650 [Fimbriimonadaceae bacterium]|nr:hypothetical protein [Fimbriimonadaceae bacterium]
MKKLNLGGRAATLLAVMTMAVSAFGFIPDQAGKSAPIPEQSQETLAQQQRFNGAQGVVGSVPLNEKRTTTRRSDFIDAPGSTGSSGSTGSAASSLTSMGQAQASAALVQVELEEGKKATAPIRMAVWGLLALIIGGGLVMVLRRYADRNLPAMPEVRRIRW